MSIQTPELSPQEAGDYLQLKSFGFPAPLPVARPYSAPILASDGMLYGTCDEGGGRSREGSRLPLHLR